MTPAPPVVLPIHTYGLPVLRRRADEVTADSPDLQRLADDMIETMRGAHGIGLAAPQVGHSVRVVTVDLGVMDDAPDAPGAEASGALVLLNPEIVPHPAAEREEFEEGCLSIPDVREVVVRPDRLRLRWLGRDFAPREIDADGMLARVIQHEIDHLDGVLFTDRVSALRKRLLTRRLRMIARGETEAEYPILTASDAR